MAMTRATLITATALAVAIARRKRSPAIKAVGVVVPVNNEGARLPACISALREAITETSRDHPEVTVMVCFALDRCSDDSAAIVAAAGYRSIDADLAGVGAARAAGAAAVLNDLTRHGRHHTFLACTDADSQVPPGWLTHQIDLANQGSDVVVGGVRPDGKELDAGRRAAWAATHLDGEANGHVHGANLGIRADAYLKAGGFAPVDEHEDVDLVSRAAAAGAQVRATDEQIVTTSGRLVGKTPGGYAGYLRDELVPLAHSRQIFTPVAET